MPDNENVPTLSERLVASLIHMQASFVLAPDFSWREAVETIDFEAVKIYEMFEAEFADAREVADAVTYLLAGTEFESLGPVEGIRKLFRDWFDTNRDFRTTVDQRDVGRDLLKRVHESVEEFNLPGGTAVDKVNELARRYRDAYPKVIILDSQNSGLSRELAEARAEIERLKRDRDDWKGRVETRAQQQLNSEDDKALLNHLLREVDPQGTYRDSLEERLANPLRQRLGLPRQFEHLPAPDCKKVKSYSGASYLHEGSKWLCTFAPFGNGESRERTGASWSQSEFRDFAPFVEMLDEQSATDR